VTWGLYGTCLLGLFYINTFRFTFTMTSNALHLKSIRLVPGARSADRLVRDCCCRLSLSRRLVLRYTLLAPTFRVPACYAFRDDEDESFEINSSRNINFTPIMSVTTTPREQSYSPDQKSTSSSRTRALFRDRADTDEMNQNQRASVRFHRILLIESREQL
jgi:hypothetical protein